MDNLDVKLVPDRLRDAAKLFEERNAAYGSNYLEIGPVLHAMFPDGLVVDSPEVWTRVFFLVHRMTKETRYAKNIRKGGHADSLEDLAVYAIMNAETDDRTRSTPPVKTGIIDVPSESYKTSGGWAIPDAAAQQPSVEIDPTTGADIGLLRPTDEWRAQP